MSAGGINTQPSLVGVPSGTAGAASPAGQSPLAVPATAATPARGTNASTATAYEPAASQDAAAQAAQAAPSGPAAWTDDWANWFAEAGVPAQMIQQLNFSGANGADEATLKQTLAQVKADADQQIEQFAKAYPDEYAALSKPEAIRAWGESMAMQDPTMTANSDRALLAQLAMAVNSGQISVTELEMQADTLGKNPIRVNVLPMAIYGTVPGYGVFRALGAPFNHGRDPITDERVVGHEPSMNVFSVLMGLGGTMALAANAKGAKQVAQARRMIAAGGDAATVAKHAGVDNLSGIRKIAAYVPGTRTNQALAGISRLDDLKAAIPLLTGDARKGAQFVYDEVVKGNVALHGDSASKAMNFFGLQPNQRGIIVGHVIGKKAGSLVDTAGVKPIALLDLNTTGAASAAHLASLSPELATGKLKAELARGFDLADDTARATLKERYLGEAAIDLLEKGAIKRPTNWFAKLWGGLKPNGTTDALHAATNVAKDTISKGHGWWAVPKPVRGGIIAAAVLGAGYLLMKPMFDGMLGGGGAEAQAGTEPQVQGQETAASAEGGAASGASAPVASGGEGSSPYTAQGMGLG